MQIMNFHYRSAIHSRMDLVTIFHHFLKNHITWSNGCRSVGNIEELMKICIFFVELWANMTFNPLFATSTQKKEL